jgi:50S ribosomal protein L16 3-hydroxylase
MYSLHLGDLSQEDFLAHYWQQQPLVIRQGLRQERREGLRENLQISAGCFIDPVSPDELAGLAGEELVESRLIQKKSGVWQAEQGPFDSYEHLGEKDWTLVVQSVNHWEPSVAHLVAPFDFIPHWRLDDVMVSYSTPGGGVGPHIDNYDAFIIQGSGRRRWRVGTQGKHAPIASHSLLKHTTEFEALIDVEMQSGDILYIPPGYPHEGISLEAAMSFSVGYRTPTATELVSGFADFLLQHDLGNSFVADPGRSICSQLGEISRDDIDRLKKKMLETINHDAQFSRFAGEYLSQRLHPLDEPGPEDHFTESALLNRIMSGESLYRLGGLRCFYLESEDDDGGTIAQGVFFIDGQRFQLPAMLKPAITALCDRPEIRHQDLGTALDNRQFTGFLCQQVNEGFWYFDRTN